MIELPKVAVVILNWNGKKFLERFLPFVVASTYPNIELIVADNQSNDDSLAFLQAAYPQIKIIQNGSNLGFAEGYNQALAKVDADYFVLLNSDVEVTPSWIEPVVELMESDPAIAVAQPKLKDWTSRVRFEYAGAAGGYIDKYGYPFCRGRIFDTLETDEGQYDDVVEIFWASGAAFFIKSEHWRRSGGFDADFFAHMEEIDLCWRLKNMGFKIMYCPKSTVYHVGGGTLDAENPFKTYLNFRNNLAMLLKNLPAERKFPVIFIRFWLDFIALLKFLLGGKFAQVGAINKAHTAFFKHFKKNRNKAGESLPLENLTGYYEGSIVWQYFGKKVRSFRDLPFKG
ncbi:glycosyltransferase family 2 protein [Pedobacter sp. SYSU D00535]|uniref:glycosyltransferase family 2 protein n=1 Tax=Pedobacter sp. SYSU D00535 TaxID=2810308 RepID=UPI001A9585A0|nr:glycosyltransferase family 2 protein [Pedobacter sp. SYSU D00535]